MTIKASDIANEAANWYESGKNKYLSYKYREAVSDLERAAALFQTDSNKNAVALFNTRAFLINAYWNSGQGIKAEHLAGNCYNQLNNFHDNENPGLVDTYLLLAEFYVSLDYSFDINDFLLEKAGRIISRSYQKDLRKSGILYSIKGYSDFLKNDIDNAYYYLIRSGEILKKFPDLVRYQIMNDVYLAYLKIQNREPNEAIQFAGNILNRNDIAPEGRLLLLHAMTLGYIELRDTLKALEYCDMMMKSAANNNTLEGTRATNTFLLSRGYIYLANYQKNKDKELFYLKKALDFALKQFDRGIEVAFLNYRIGWIYNFRNEPLIALRYAQKALIASSFEFNDTSVLSIPPASKLMNFDNIIPILSLKGTALPLINTNDKSYTKLALQCFEMAYSMLDRQLHKIDMENAELNTVDLQQNLLSYVVTYANYIYRYTGEEEYARKAFHYAEKGKAQVLKIYTGKAETLKNCGVPDSIIERSDRIGNDILQTENMIALTQEKGDDISKLTDKLTYLCDQRDFLNYEIERKYPSYRNSGYPRIPEIEEIQSVLQPDQALIEYEMVMQQIIIFVITKTGFYQHYQPINNNTRFHLENLRQLVSSPPVNDNNDSTFRSFVKSSAYLYNLLIRPVYNKIQGKRLIIIPQGKMNLIPFEVLISEDYNGRSDYTKLNWLIREFPVMYAFSASYLVDMKDLEFGKGMAAFMPVYSNRSDSLSYLHGAEDEVQFLRRRLGFTVFSGLRSDEVNFRKKAPAFRIIHIASHTITNDVRPDLSGFILNQPEGNSNDGRLFAFEIKQLKLNAQMVVLNGCNTGYGALKRGEGMVSLARSFFFTGIRTVAYTLWPVADRAAHDLVIGFYKQIHKQQPPDLALMKSKLDFIKNSDPVKSHPYYWAGFIVSGKSQVIPWERDYIKPAAIILLFLVIAAAYMIWREYQRRREARI